MPTSKLTKAPMTFTVARTMHQGMCTGLDPHTIFLQAWSEAGPECCRNDRGAADINGFTEVAGRAVDGSIQAKSMSYPPCASDPTLRDQKTAKLVRARSGELIFELEPSGLQTLDPLMGSAGGNRARLRVQT
jgi:hypothetical protein